MDGRWESLFADADAQFEALRREEMSAEAADRSRREFALIGLVDRLRGALGAPVEVSVESERITGTVCGVGPDWILLDGPAGRSVLIPLTAVVAVSGLPGRTSAPGTTGAVEARLDLRYALRRLARDRAPIRVLLRGGRSAFGTFDRVGRDFVEFAEHVPGDARRVGAVRAVRSIPLDALLAVHAR
ncbi:hypothetical protein [Cryptosporangium aurantiacum]|uniref:hypothetical protein n=1 Tax=Cryptosporangium aurantiacum TaxID=134849 RepID=UPI00093275CC|nr:hypothetical protein [Cryptosporangium aurantiacum]